jgi:flagellar biosynthesis/type III secretory pathway chaperone
MEELEECNKSKEAMVLKVKGLERIREKASREMAIVVGVNPETARLLEIASKLLDPQSSKLRSIHSTLDLLIRRIKELNDANEVLVKSSLKAVTGALGAIRQTLQPKSTYAASGEVKKNEVAGHFVSKEI